jgi:tetratricopeptide (TPR) repeat protein
MPIFSQLKAGLHMRRGLLIALLLAAAARADSGSDEARAAYDAGSSEYDLGHYKDALLDFEKAFRLRHVPALLFNIAQCHRMLGEMKEAATVYRSFIGKDPNNPRIEQARTLLEQVEAAVNSHTEAQAAKPTEVTGSQEAVAEPMRKPAIAPVVQRPAQQPSRPGEDVALVDGKRPVRTVAPDRVIEARRIEPATPAQQPRSRPWTWLAGTGAVAATGAGLAFGARSQSTQSSLRDSLHAGGEVQSLQANQINDAHRANALFVIGGVLAVTAGVLFVLEY